MSREQRDRPLDIVGALLALLLCQLAGETIVQAVKLFAPQITFPGPVIGMGLLFVWMASRRRVAPSLNETAGSILRNLSLLFVPAAVGVVQYWDVIRQFGLPLLAALILSTILTLLVTVGTFIAVARLVGRRGDAA